MPLRITVRLTVRAGVAASAAALLLSGCAGSNTASASTSMVFPARPAANVAPGAAAVGATASVAKVVAASAIASSAATAKAATSLYAGRVRAYGDSVMLGAKDDLRQQLHAKVYAVESRQSWAVLSLVRTDWRHGRIHGPVVIHTGTNGTVSRQDLERTIRPIQRHHLVVLVNVKAARSWVSANNALLGAVDRKWSHVVLLDWHAAASRHSSWTYSDGIHLTPSGRSAYTRAVAKLLHR